MSGPGHGPIEVDQRELMNGIAEALDKLFNKLGGPSIVFTLLVAKAGDIKDGRVNYISNGQRDDVVAMMKELIARFEGRYSQEESGKQ